MSSTSQVSRLTLGDLPAAARLTLAAFLISIGIGYFSALVQLHFQHAQPGELMPTGDDAVRIFSHPPRDQKKASKLERLLVADENLSFNGSGQMSDAFTRHSREWKEAIDERARGFAGRRGEPAPADRARAEQQLREERNGERQAVIAWIRAGATREDYEKGYCLPEDLAKQSITPDYVVKDEKRLSRLEQLLIADEKLPFNSKGQMSGAFTKRSSGWNKEIKKRGENVVRKEREGEREGVLAWIRAGAARADYDKDRFPLSAGMAKRSLTARYVVKDAGKPMLKIKTLLTDRCARCHSKEGGEDAKAAEIPLDSFESIKKYIASPSNDKSGTVLKIKALLTDRCARCHKSGGDDAKAADYPLETYPQIKKYLTTDSGGAMSLTKLAQTTHVHLLGFAMLYGLTGLLLAFTSYPGWLRGLLAPLPLLAQVVDISLWWLARLDEPYGPTCARFIPFTGMIVGGSLGLQLLLALFDLFGRAWKLSLAVLILVVPALGYAVKQKVIDPHLQTEKPVTTTVTQ